MRKYPMTEEWQRPNVEGARSGRQSSLASGFSTLRLLDLLTRDNQLPASQMT